MRRAQNADTHVLKQNRLSQNISPVCSSFVLVIASDMHLEPESEKRARNVDFHTTKIIQIKSFSDEFLQIDLRSIYCSLTASRRWTWHSPNGQHHNQIDYILVRKRFRSGVSIARTRSFPGADIGSDHGLLMITFRLRLKKNQQAKTHKTQV